MTFDIHHINNEKSFNRQISSLHEKYKSLIKSLNVEHKEYGSKHKKKLTEKLNEILRQEGVIEEPVK